jgi:RNA polymerase sigma factor (sigma-70 family)
VRTLKAVDQTSEQTSEEADRWAAALAGSSEAFAWLFDLHHDRVYRHALRMLDSVHDAEDVTAGAFFELWRRRDAVTLVAGSVLPWLLVTTSNLSRNAARSLRRYRLLLRSLPRSEPSRGAGEMAEERLEASAGVRQIREALRSLSASDAVLIAMTAFEGFSPSEVATALGISDGAARTRLHRARARVGSALESSVGKFLTTGPEQGAR